MYKYNLMYIEVRLFSNLQKNCSCDVYSSIAM